MYVLVCVKKSYGADYEMPFQQQYAGLILELERINKDLNDYLIGVQQCLHEVCEKSLDVSFVLKIQLGELYFDQIIGEL